jgi:hypothetical protein
LGFEKPDHYFNLVVHGQTYKVHRLINRAFNGAPPSRSHTTDHLTKYGDKRKERQDNHANNLEWKDKSEQSKNRIFSDVKRADDRPLEVCSEWTRDDWIQGEWVWFQSQAKASAVMGVHSVSVGNWLVNKPCKMGWLVRWAPPSETQDDLQATNDDPVEVWKKVDDTTWVSSRGRAWQRYHGSKTWRKYTPRPMDASYGYPRISIKHKLDTFHLIVFDAFFPGIRGDLTIDHINRDRGDNRLSNLRLATRSEQSCNRTFKPKGDGYHDSQKTRIRYRLANAPDDVPWDECLGCIELERRLTKATGKNYFNGNISTASIGKTRGNHKHKYKDYVFYKV